ncbi:small subunit rRNA processing factor, putative [Plasmodium vivax]|uniref:Small subunit rRNA processing factor, putative n=1 Tax=Plasmodium vivax TaxID=5855 RepID=A0A1G4H598_PLAVI|nr:small subunit rRNA processing factor, putative [Plasmodium vivax]
MEGNFSTQKKAPVGIKKPNGGKHIIRGRRGGAPHKVGKEMGKQKGRPNGEGETEWDASSNRNGYNPRMKGKGVHPRFNSSLFRKGQQSGNMGGVTGKGKHQGGLHGGGRKSTSGAANKGSNQGGNKDDGNDPHTLGDAYYYDNESSAVSEGEAPPTGPISHAEENTSRKEPRINSDQQPTMDYVEYVSSLKKGEDPNSDERKTLHTSEGKDEVGGEAPNGEQQKGGGEEQDGADEHQNGADEQQNGADHRRGVFNIFLLFCPLAVTSIRNRRCVINADEHMSFLQNKLKSVESLLACARNAKESAFLRSKAEAVENKLKNVRLDVLFFTLLCLRDSVINKRGRLQIYLHTVNGLLIYVSPSFRVPRSFSLFKKVMLNLMLRNVVLDPGGRPLLKVLPHPVHRYVGSSVCIGISHMGFPADVKKLSKQIKETKNDYSFFLSLSSAYDLTHFIESISRTHSECFPFDYVVRVSDLPLSTVAVCSKLTHFLND